MPALTLRAAASLALALLATAAGAQDRPLEGQQAERFLREAAVVAREPLGTGVTRSERLTLSDGTHTARACFKTIHERVMGLSRMQWGGTEFDFRDSWKHEVAAYELDKLLGLGLVPPTVERTVEGRRGALQLWVEGAMTEVERRRLELRPTDGPGWNAQRAGECLLRELARDTDENQNNVLIAPGFRVWAIDFSRAFRIQPELLSPGRLIRFPADALERLEALDRAALDARLSPWLDRMQLEALLARRDAIVALASQRVGERGVAATILP
jgi:hypothetical protein